ncbi:MAG: DUF433 domain-containing protein [Chloroflexota bacterium]
MAIRHHREVTPAIERVADIRNGAPVIAGTGIRVSDVIHYKRLYDADGKDWIAETIRAVPQVTREQLEAAITYYQVNTTEIDSYLAKERSIDEEMQSRQSST